MKKLLALLLIVSLKGIGQIQLTETVKPIKIGGYSIGGNFVTEINMYVKGQDTSYHFMHRNHKYQQILDIKSVIFNAEGNTLNSFYELLMSAFSDENKDKKDFKVNFKLGGKDVYITNDRVMGMTSVTFWNESGYVSLTEKQVKKTFGKK
jgi:hypothetical protein